MEAAISLDRFNVTKSKSVRILTIGAWVIVVTICLFILWQGIRHPVALLITVPILAIVIGVLVYYHRQSPLYIELMDDALVLYCVSGNKIFRYEDIVEVGKWQGRPSRLLRQWGSGGFGGYIGWFSGGGLGSHFEYVGKYQDAFYLKLRKGKPYMLSCDEAEQIVEHIQSVISR